MACLWIKTGSFNTFRIGFALGAASESRNRRHRQKSVGGGNPDLKNCSSKPQVSPTAEAEYNQLLKLKRRSSF